MTTRTMFDAVDANDVPSFGWDLLAGYSNGLYRSYEPLRKRFPHATVVSIDTQNKPGDAQVCDIEKGDARPDEAPAWFDASLALGIVRPTLYYSSSDHATIKSYMGSRKYDAWVASYGVSHCPVSSDSQVNVVAWQKIDHGPHGENIDVSDVFDPDWPHLPQEDDLTPEQAAKLDAIYAALSGTHPGSSNIEDGILFKGQDGKNYRRLDRVEKELAEIKALLQKP